MGEVPKAQRANEEANWAPAFTSLLPECWHNVTSRLTFPAPSFHSMAHYIFPNHEPNQPFCLLMAFVYIIIWLFKTDLSSLRLPHPQYRWILTIHIQTSLCECHFILWQALVHTALGLHLYFPCPIRWISKWERAKKVKQSQFGAEE